MAIFLLTSSAMANTTTDATAKAELKIIYLAYESWNSSTTGYIEPQPYTTDAKTQKITGQNFTNPVSTEKYIKITLNADSTKATLREAPKDYAVSLTWENARITGVKIEGLSRCDYTVVYDEKTGAFLKLVAKEVVNKTFRYEHVIDFSGELISKITRFENPLEGKKTWIRCVKTYEHKGNETIVKTITYKSNLPNKPENIFSTQQQSYKKLSNDSYATQLPLGEIIETTYNADNTIASKKVNVKGKVDATTYTYKNNQLFKEELKRTQANVFLEHTIIIYFSLTDQASFVEDYEKTKGTYKFDQKGTLILEARDNKFRTKTNGVWGPWMQAK